MRYRFAGFMLDSALREIHRGDTPVQVQPKVFDLLLCLLENHTRVLSRDELLREVWPGVATTDGSLARAVSLAREALGDRDEGRVVATSRGHGYRIGVPVDRVDAGALGGVTSAFVGRDRELARLHEALDHVRAGHSGAVFVSGEPGVGKSRLVEEFARSARGRDAEVLRGAAYEREGAPAYWPWTQMLTEFARARDVRMLRADLGRETAALATLAPSLMRFAGSRRRTATRDRRQHFEAVAALLDRASARRPLVLCFDDLHWADEASLELLGFVATGARTRRVLVIGTLRETEAGETLAATRACCARALAFAFDLRVTGLSVGEVERFLTASIPADRAHALAPTLHARTEGNPFFLQEIVRAADPGDFDAPAPASVRQAIHLRLWRLSPECVDLLRLAAVIGRHFGVRVLARAAGCTDAEALARIDEAEGAAVLVAGAGPDPAYRFAHELIREVLYESQPRTARSLAHRSIAEALEALYAHAERPPLAELAHHFGEAVDGGDPAHAVTWATRAGEQALERLAYEQAARHFDAALRALDADRRPEPRRRCEILLLQADACYRMGAIDRAAKCFWQVIDLARGADLVEPFARAAVGLARRDIGNKGVVPEQRVQVLEDALATVDPDQHGLRARMLAALSADLYWKDLERSERMACAALAAARRAEDPSAAFCALGERFHFLVLPAHRAERDALNSEMLAVAAAEGDLEGEFAVRRQRLEGFLTDARRMEADTEIRHLAALAERMAQPGLVTQVRVARAARALWRGARAEAEALVQSPDTDDRHARQLAYLSYAPQLFLLRRMQGRLHALDGVLREGLHRFPRVHSFRCALAQLLVERGRLDEARDHWSALRGLAGLRADANHAIDLAMLAEVCVALGDSAAAAPLYERLRPHAGTNLVLSVMVSMGSADRHLGRLAALRGDLDAGTAHLESALRIESAMRARLWQAYAERDLAGVRAQLGDAAGARRHALRSARLARELRIAL